MAVHLISDERLTLQDLSRILAGGVTIRLSEESKRKINQCREYLNQKLENSSETIYGINTGFGSLYNKNISTDHLEKLQENLVKSHACGTGPEVPDEIVKLMLLLKVQSLSYGYSGVQLVTVERLVDMFNAEVFPAFMRWALSVRPETWHLWHIWHFRSLAWEKHIIKRKLFRGTPSTIP